MRVTLAKRSASVQSGSLVDGLVQHEGLGFHPA